ncbi:MAG: carbon storage regulator CsrA [Candidatus Brocadiaceae baterium WH-1]|nr:MAG: carbon storage regulator CsrA [Candidatus Jettenia sp. AMX2]
MLILTRKLGESLIIQENIEISVIEINKNNVKLGINAPKDITIHRQEIFKKIKEENQLASSSGIIDLADSARDVTSLTKPGIPQAEQAL